MVTYSFGPAAAASQEQPQAPSGAASEQPSGQSDGGLTGGRRDPAGRFLRGNRAAVPGSRRGRRNRRTLAGLELLEQLERGGEGLPPVEERLRVLLTDPDPHVRLRMEVWLFTMQHGLPPRRELHPPSPLDSEEWVDLKARLLAALEQHPAALKSVLDAIDPVSLSRPQEVEVKLQWLDAPDP